MKWGILATGTIARKFADTVVRMPQDRECIVAVGSRTTESALAFAQCYQIERAYDSYEALCMDQEVEAVYISTPNNLHYENARMCIEVGKHVLCEKPFTIFPQEAEELYGIAKARGVFIMEAFWIRFLPLLNELKRMIEADVIGEIKHIRCEFGFIAHGDRKKRKFNSDLGGGALLDIGIYNLGFVHMVMGEIPVHFASNATINEYGTDDFSSILLEYPDGKTAAVTTSIGMNMPREAVIFGTKGSICLPDYQQAQMMSVRPYDGDAYEVRMPFEINGFEYQIAEVSRCVAAGLNTSDLLRKEDSLTVLRLMEDIRKSWDMKFTFEQ